MILAPSLIGFRSYNNNTGTPPVDYINLPSGAVATFNSNAEVISAFGSTTIQNKKFTNPSGAQNGNIFRFFGCSGITIKNCYFTIAHGGDEGGNRAIYFSGCSNMTVDSCLFNNVGSALLASTCTSGIVFRRNQCVNMRGPFPGGQFVQLNTCSGGGHIIELNRGENWLGESFPEDMVNMFSSSGTSLSNILVQDNIFRGGGPSQSGGGMVAGDNNGDFVTIRRNKLFDCGQYGVGIVGGDNNKVLDNDVYCVQKAWTNVGIPVYKANSICTNVTVTGNRVNYTNSAGSPNPFYYPGGVDNCTGTKDVPGSLTLLQMAFPSTVINFINDDQLWQLRHGAKVYESEIITATTNQGYAASLVSRPTANAGTDQTISGGNATLTSTSTNSSGNTITGYRWVQVSGPGFATIVSPNSASTSITGLLIGTYVFRLEVTQSNTTQDADWINVTRLL